MLLPDPAVIYFGHEQRSSDLTLAVISSHWAVVSFLPE